MDLIIDSNEVVFVKKQNSIEKEIEKFQDKNSLLFYKESFFSTYFKINISLLSSIEKLHFLKIVKNEIDYALTLPNVEKVHDVVYLSNEIENALITKKVIVNCKDFGFDFTNMNYSNYLIFEIIDLGAIPKLETIDDVINNVKNYTHSQYFISVPFFRSLMLLNNNSNDIELHITTLEINKKTALVFKAYFNNNSLQASKFYDIHYNPTLGTGKPLSHEYNRSK
jgi:hypothetical protein